MDEEFDGQPRVLRVRSANVSDDLSRKYPSNSSSFQQRPLHRPKSSAVHRSSSVVRNIFENRTGSYVYRCLNSTLVQQQNQRTLRVKLK